MIVYGHMLNENCRDAQICIICPVAWLQAAHPRPEGSDLCHFFHAMYAMWMPFIPEGPLPRQEYADPRSFDLQEPRGATVPYCVLCPCQIVSKVGTPNSPAVLNIPCFIMVIYIWHIQRHHHFPHLQAINWRKSSFCERTRIYRIIFPLKLYQ